MPGAAVRSRPAAFGRAGFNGGVVIDSAGASVERAGVARLASGARRQLECHGPSVRTMEHCQCSVGTSVS